MGFYILDIVNYLVENGTYPRPFKGGATMPASMAAQNLEARADAVRHFNRFYTRQIGLLQEGLLDTQFSLTEARVLYELAHRERSTAAEIGTDLGLDAGYMSRILRSFEKRMLIEKTPSELDRRENLPAPLGQREQALPPVK